jgi:hypothetical protein
MRLQDIAPNLALTGLEPDLVVTVLAVMKGPHFLTNFTG